MTRDIILSRLNDEYTALLSLLDSLTPAQRTTPNVIGTWSVKDMLAHLIYWNRRPTDEISAALNGYAFAYDQRDDDIINAETVSANRGRAWEDVMADFQRSFRAVVALVEMMPEEAFDEGGEVMQRLGNSLDDALAIDTYAHYAEHRVQIEAWLAGL